MQKVDVSMIFTPLKEIRSELYQAVGEYQGKIEYFDADRLIRETAMTFYKKGQMTAEGCFVIWSYGEQRRGFHHGNS